MTGTHTLVYVPVSSIRIIQVKQNEKKEKQKEERTAKGNGAGVY